MKIGHIFKIDDDLHYINIERWSVIGDNYLLNVFTDYNYSNSLMSREYLIKVKIWIKLYRIRTQATIFPFVNTIFEQNKTLVSICVV